MSRTVLGLTLTAAALAIALVASVSAHHKKGNLVNADSSCVASEGEKCPSPKFLQLYDRMQRLNAEVAASDGSERAREIEDKKLLSKGILAELTETLRNFYPGYDFNGDKRKLVITPPTKSVPPAPAATGK